MFPNIIEQSAIISHQDITVDSILPEHKNLTSLTIEHCTSKVWKKVGKALASLWTLQSLTLLHCNTKDDFCRELTKSKCLLRLRMGTCLLDEENCGITEEGVRHITNIRQIEELTLGKFSNY